MGIILMEKMAAEIRDYNQCFTDFFFKHPAFSMLAKKQLIFPTH